MLVRPAVNEGVHQEDSRSWRTRRVSDTLVCAPIAGKLCNFICLVTEVIFPQSNVCSVRSQRFSDVTLEVHLLKRIIYLKSASAFLLDNISRWDSRCVFAAASVPHERFTDGWHDHMTSGDSVRTALNTHTHISDSEEFCNIIFLFITMKLLWNDPYWMKFNRNEADSIW